MYYGPKKSIVYPVFPIYHKEITALMPFFCYKNIHSLKNILFSCLYFVKITSIFSKTPSSHVAFENNFMKNILLSGSYLIQKKRQFCQNYTVLWSKKVNRLNIISYFHENVTSLITIFIKKRSIFKEHNTLISIFCQKTSNVSKTKCLHVFLFSSNIQ